MWCGRLAKSNTLSDISKEASWSPGFMAVSGKGLIQGWPLLNPTDCLGATQHLLHTADQLEKRELWG